MSAPPPSDSESSLARLIRTTLQYDTNVMLAAIISLLLVILFVLLLHLYTRWFLVHARRRSRSSVTVPHVLGSRLHHRFTIIDTSTNSDHSSGKSGLPFSIISLLPLFVYKFPSDEYRDYGLDCAICLSVFEEEEIGRKLPGCGHAFHVECIDMWLHSHSTCPICRAAIQCNHIPKIDHLILEIDDPDQNSDVLAINNEEELRSEIVSTISNQIPETRETAEVAVEHDGGTSGLSSSSIGETFKKLLSNNSSCSNRSGGNIHPSSNINGDESMA